MVAPVVLITTGGMITNGLLAMYGAVNDRMREMTAERLEILTGPDGELLSPANVSPVGQERLAEIRDQLPRLVLRHRLVRHSVLLIYGALGLLGLSVIGIAIAVQTHSEVVGSAALALVLGGVVVLFSGLTFAARSLHGSADAIQYAIERTDALDR